MFSINIKENMDCLLDLVKEQGIVRIIEEMIVNKDDLHNELKYVISKRKINYKWLSYEDFREFDESIGTTGILEINFGEYWLKNIHCGKENYIVDRFGRIN